MIKKTLLGLSLILSSSNLFAVSSCSFADDILTHNGHYYGITGNTMEYDEAQAFAEQYGGYLAVPDTNAENTFLKELTGGGDGAWIGVKDFSMSSNYCFTSNSCSTPNRFTSIKGLALAYTNWDSYQPDNLVQPYDVVDGKQMVSPLGEHWGVLNGNSGKWYDTGNHMNNTNNPAKFRALIEFNTAPTCYQTESTVSDSWSTKMCNTQIYDTTTGNVDAGTILNCQNDSYGTSYCPSALAPASETWDYESGYSTYGVGSVVDYASKVNSSTDCSYAATFSSYDTLLYSWSGDRVAHSMIIFYEDFVIKTWLVGGMVRGVQVRIKGVFYNGNYSDTASNGVYTIIWTGYRASRDNAGLTSYKLYQKTSGYSCPNGGTLSGSTCVKTCSTITCPSGYTETTGTETSKGQCKKTIEYTYYNYLCYNNANSQGYNYAPTTSGGNCNKTDTDTSNINSSTLDDACNSSTPTANNCARKEFKCQYNNERPPVWVDNKWQCSPFPCYGEESVEVAGTVEGANDTNNDGWSEDGACNGQIYIFNGKDHRCRDSDVFFGLTGGGCCEKDKVFAGLVQCKENEKILAKKNKAEFCHYVGTYCSKYLKLGFAKICIQKSKSHCCFSSKIARAIQEQGRPQLSIDWGSGNSPQCRGFTPEEFQKLDFSKIDLSNEFDIPTINSSELNNTLNTAVTNLQNMLNSN